MAKPERHGAGKRNQKKKRAKTLAERADKFVCYQLSVQSPEHEIEFFDARTDPEGIENHGVFVIADRNRFRGASDEIEVEGHFHSFGDTEFTCFL